MVDVMFVRVPFDSAPMLTTILRNMYLAGWRVVSHSEGHEEYSFVLEGSIEPRNPTGFGFGVTFQTIPQPALPAGVVPTSYTGTNG